ncbi:MAG: BTAD domain-containing putative transcriptional regulator [bacterium]
MAESTSTAGMRVHLRGELVERVLEIERHALVLLIAPGGAGKSTLVRAWQAERRAAGERMAWLSIGPLQRDPIVFVEDLVESIREELPEPLEGAEPFGTALLRALPRSGEIAPDPIVRLLERELRGLGRSLAVCLDGFEHLDPDDTVFEIVDRLLRAAPAWLRLVIASRGLRPHVSTRLLADGSAIEISADELSLRDDQVQAVLADADVCLETRQAEQLLARTGGWAIAIRFAARALAGVEHGGRARFIDALVHERDLFRYIASELLAGTPPEVASLLELASLLGPVARETLVAATEDPAAWRHIEQAIHQGLLQASGDEIELHELLGDWLRMRLESQMAASEWRALHRRLGRLLEMHRRDMNALRLYVSAGLHEDVAALLARAAHGWVNRGHYELAAQALETLPQPLRRSDPALMAVAGVIEGSRDPDTAIERLKVAIEMYRRAGNRAAEFEAMHELGIIAINENRMPEVIGLFRHALTLRRVLLEPRLRGMVVLAIADGSYVAGRYSFALRLLDLADTYDHAPRERGGISLVRSTILFHRGDWDRVIADVDERCADEAQRLHGPGFFAMQTRRCAALGLRGIDVSGCRATLVEASRMFVTARQTLNRLNCELVHGQIALRAGDLRGARELFSVAAALARRIRLDEAEAACQGFLARVHQQLGETNEALEAASVSLGLLERPDTWAARFSDGPLRAAGAALGAMVYAELADARRPLEGLESKLKRLEHRELPLCAHALRLCCARVADRAGDASRTLRHLRAAWRVQRDARLRDFAPEVDEPLHRWAVERARDLGLSRTKTGAEASVPSASQPPSLRIDTLGGLAVHRGARRISDREWRGETARRLLVRLLAADGRPVVRERLEADLWPDASPSRARANLRVALTRLRDVLEPRRRKGAASRYVEVEGERVALTEDARAGWDVRLWREALADLEQASDALEADRARSALERARAIRGGPLLPECFDDWALDLRRETDEHWLRVGRRAAAHWLGAPDPELAERVADALLEAHRDDEESWSLLARARLARGDRSGALRALEDARLSLAASLDLEPGPLLLGLESEIRGAGVAASQRELRPR